MTALRSISSSLRNVQQGELAGDQTFDSAGNIVSRVKNPVQIFYIKDDSCLSIVPQGTICTNPCSPLFLSL